MNSKLNFYATIVVFVFTVGKLASQEELSVKQYETSIQLAFKQLVTAQTDAERQIINNKIIGLFDKVLPIKASFAYPFDSLRNVSKLTASDSLVRVVSWNIPRQDGDYEYFAYIQQLDKRRKKLKLFKLLDASGKIEQPEFKKLDDENWYGALYYHIETTTEGKKTYYTLLGWDGNNNFTNKKIVECFYIDGNKLVLGPPIFKMEKGVKNRLVFEFGKQVKMMLRYDNKLKMIVYDHLAPSHKKFTGQYMYYGPDMSQDGIQFIQGFWVVKPNLDLRNMEVPTGKSIKKSF
jgi:hypothetical protein